MNSDELITYLNELHTAVDLEQYSHRMESDVSIYRNALIDSAEFYLHPFSDMYDYFYYAPRPTYFGCNPDRDYSDIVGGGDTHHVIGSERILTADDMKQWDLLPLDGYTFGATVLREWNGDVPVFAACKKRELIVGIERNDHKTITYTLTDKLGQVGARVSDSSNYLMKMLGNCRRFRWISEKYADIYASDLQRKGLTDTSDVK